MLDLVKASMLGVRKIKVLKKDLHIYFVNGLCDTAFIIQIMEALIEINEFGKPTTQVYDVVKNSIVEQSVEEVKTINDLVDQVLCGLIVIVVDGTAIGLAVDVRSYPGRQPEEPDTEKIVRGSRDGFVENIIVNTAITRRRIRDERLRFEMIKVGERSKTDIAIGYIENIADPDLIEIVRKELKSIKIDGLTMADKTVEEFIVRQSYNPYPLIRYTERADVAATHLLEGHVIVYVDTSPSVIITPATIFHHMQHAEEYRQSPAVGTMIRWARFLGIFASIFLLPLWFLFVLEPTLLPEKLKFIGPNEHTNIPIVMQIFISDIGLEFLRMAAVHTPTPLASAMGLIAAVLIGQIAIDVGLFVPEVILYASIATVGTFLTPSFELGVANKIARLVLLIAVALFKLPGLIIGTTLFILLLVGTKDFKYPIFMAFYSISTKGFISYIN